MKDFIVHIGYHKTGTTFLQNFIFPNLKSIKYFAHNHEHDLLKKFIERPLIEINLDYFKNKINGLEGDKILYSNENLIGPLFFYTGIGKINIANNLKKIGATKVIITIRNQIDTIDSVYREYIQEGGVANFNTFIDEWRFSFNLNHLVYYDLIKYYEKLFGKENLLILLNEEIKQNQSKSIERLEKFTNSTYIPSEIKTNNQSANVSLSNLSLKIVRFFNHFLKSTLRPSNSILPNKMKMSFVRGGIRRYLDPYLFSKLSNKKRLFDEDMAVIFFEKYKSKNNKLAEEFNLDLKKYNYPL